MATIDILCANGVVRELTLTLRQNEFHDRHFYLTQEVQDWIIKDLPHIPPCDLNHDDVHGRATPTEQIRYILRQYITGANISHYRQAHFLEPKGNGVFEFKTPDTRIFGWFVRKDKFVAARANSAENIKKHKLYDGYVAEIIKFRDRLDLDPPKFVTGSIEDVLSN
jgi:hypothetical protein